jgi:hypothetical protein
MLRGIDGVISLDRLGLEKVYVQAKRWKGTVSRPDVQGFYGALAGQRANKGIFITTSSFTTQATEFAASVERIVLVDGQRLTQLMIEHGVGVSHRNVRIANTIRHCAVRNGDRRCARPTADTVGSSRAAQQQASARGSSGRHANSRVPCTTTSRPAGPG